MLESEELTLDELARRVGVSPRAIRYYLTTGLLERPPKRGRELRFGADQELRLRAIRELQKNGLSLEAIARRLEQMTRQELQFFERPGQAPPLERLLLADTGAMPLYLRSTGVPDRVARLPLGRARSEEGEAWIRLRVTPQVEIQYRSDAGPRVEQAVRQIVELARGLLEES